MKRSVNAFKNAIENARVRIYRQFARANRNIWQIQWRQFCDDHVTDRAVAFATWLASMTSLVARRFGDMAYVAYQPLDAAIVRLHGHALHNSPRVGHANCLRARANSG